MKSQELILTFLIISAIVILFRHQDQDQNESLQEGFTMSPCPNCGKRDRFQCFQCDTCGWCVTPQGYGECVPGDANGAFFRKDCINWQYQPNLMNDYTMFLPGQRRWWWWHLPYTIRSRLRGLYNYPQKIVP